MKNIIYLFFVTIIYLFFILIVVPISVAYSVTYVFDAFNSHEPPSKPKNVLREYTLIDSNANEVYDVFIFEDDGKKFMLTRGGYRSIDLEQIVE